MGQMYHQRRLLCILQGSAVEVLHCIIRTVFATCEKYEVQEPGMERGI